MSRSYRTDPVRVQAARRRALAPLKLVERLPRPGDVHVLTRRQLAALLPQLPLELVNGLRRIELLPRASDALGDPFGFYTPSERTIGLYSLPAGEWRFPSMGTRFSNVIQECGGEVFNSGTGTVVRWRTRKGAARFMLCWVFMHELGHHLDWRYAHKRKLPPTVRMREESADMHMRRSIASNWATLQMQGREVVRSDLLGQALSRAPRRGKL